MDHDNIDIPTTCVFGDCRHCSLFWTGALAFDASKEDRCLAAPGQGCVPPMPPPEELEVAVPLDLGAFLAEQEEAQRGIEAFMHLPVIALRDRLKKAA